MYQTEINILTGFFSPIALHEMDSVMLMDRIETKYVFSSKKLDVLLALLSTGYKILDIDMIRIFPYHTTYLDTPDHLFYMDHVRGKLNRHKIRYRCYESTGTSFLEIKKKTNKGRTVKCRIENRLYCDSPDETAFNFINELLHYPCLDIKPVLINGFNRITLVGVKCKERITLDYNIAFSNSEGNSSELPFLAIAEIKRERHCGFSPFSSVMKEFGISPNSFSKYCIGSAITNETLRKNTMKQNLILINKIQNEYFKSA